MIPLLLHLHYPNGFVSPALHLWMSVEGRTRHSSTNLIADHLALRLLAQADQASGLQHVDEAIIALPRHFLLKIVSILLLIVAMEDEQILHDLLRSWARATARTAADDDRLVVPLLQLDHCRSVRLCASAAFIPSLRFRLTVRVIYGKLLSLAHFLAA